VRDNAAVRAKRDDIGEGAAAVDPELPFIHVCFRVMVRER
jgi:hypothetical protein